MHAPTPTTLGGHSRWPLSSKQQKTSLPVASCRASPSLLRISLFFFLMQHCDQPCMSPCLQLPSRWLLLVLTPFPSAPTALNVLATLGT